MLKGENRTMPINSELYVLLHFRNHVHIDATPHNVISALISQLQILIVQQRGQYYQQKFVIRSLITRVGN